MKTTIITLVFLLLVDFLCPAKQFKNDDNYPSSFNPDYVAPSARIRFYGKTGLINTTKKYRGKRLNPENEWAILKKNIAERKIQRIKTVDSDFASVVGTNYYQKNGLVSVSSKYLKRRQGAEMQLSLIYGRDLYMEKNKKLASYKPIQLTPINKIEVEFPVKQKRDTQEVVSPR
jgi:hypothetical protein